MEHREVRVEYGRTVNLGNDESERLTVGFTTTLAPGEDTAFAVAQIYEELREQVASHLGIQPQPVARPTPEAD